MQRTAKRPIVLMELLVALVLIGAVLFQLLKFFSNTLQMDRKIDAIRKEASTREHAQIRLLHLFTSIVPKTSLPDAASPSLFSLEEPTSGLRAIFDNGIDPDPRFSGAVLGELSLEGSNLFLSIRPFSAASRKTVRKELLLHDVQELEIQFLSKKTAPLPRAPSFEWIKKWPKNRWDVPSIIRVIAKRKEGDLAFAFSLPFADPITYKRLSI